MKNKFNYYAAVWALCLVLFNVISFVTQSQLTVIDKFGGSFWIGYIFVTLAFAGQLACAYIVFKEENLQKLFYKIPLIQISYTGLVVMLIVGAVGMALPFFPEWICAIVCLIVLVVNISAVIKASAAGEIVSEIDDKMKAQTQFIKLLSADAEHLVATTKNAEIKAQTKKVYDAIRYSDPMSNPALAEVEEQIRREFEVFCSVVKAGEVNRVIVSAEKIIELIDMRNKKCKVLK